jgi:hypothetical protein
MPVVFYKLERVEIPDPKPGEFRIQTAAFWDCALCGSLIATIGGPGDGEICIACGDFLKTGRARGAIVREEEP